MRLERASQGYSKTLLTKLVFVIPRCCQRLNEKTSLLFPSVRYGVFDEHGFADDPLYPNYHHVKGEVFPTGTANDLVNGEWIDGTERFNCNPAEEKNCYFKPAGDNSHLTCSVGYLHYLPSVHSYCKPEDIQGKRPNRTENKLDLQKLQH